MKPTTDLCDEYGEKLRVLAPGLQHFGGKHAFYGAVVTVSAPRDNSKVAELLEGEGLGRVLVVDGGAAMDCALLGDRLAELAVRNGWAGVIVNGCIRDTAQIGTMPLAVMALGSFPRKTIKQGRGEINIEIEFLQVKIRPGDYLYADDDGVVLSPELLI